MPQDRSAQKTQLPAISLPGVTFSFANLAPGIHLFGRFDAEVIFAGTHLAESLQLYVDGRRVGEKMTHLRRNRYTQGLDTAEFYDGSHQVAVAAIDGRGGVLAKLFCEVYFRNLVNFNFISFRTNDESNGYVAYLKLNTIRTEIPPSAFVCIDRFGEEREKLESAVTYEGRWDGTPIARLSLVRKDGRALVTGIHRLRLAIQDNQGSPITFADHKVMV